MKSWCVLVVYLLLVPALSSAQSPQVRVLDKVAGMAYEQGYAQSQTFRALVATLEASDVIVHVVTSRALQTQVSGATRFVTRQGGWRYVRIELSASLTQKSRTSVLGHELQHAVEIANCGATTADAVLAFYRTSGMKATTLVDGWESEDALRIERRVWSELGRPSRAARTVEE